MRPMVTLNGLFGLPIGTEPQVEGHINITSYQRGRVIEELLLFFCGKHR